MEAPQANGGPRGHSISSEKRLEKFYPGHYPVMVQISPGCVACREEDDEHFNEWLYENRAQLETLRLIS